MRLFITLLSLGSMISFGYALAGYGGKLFGRGRTDYVVVGLIAGLTMAALSLYLWKKYLPSFLEDVQEDESPDGPDDKG
ncbi:MAG: hypothetical protein GX256_10235 [Fretibacterium sp.]|nr:hypothetical protein [Fretibacterium sp.]